jgi:ketosteroid isomerase-like protein
MEPAIVIGELNTFYQIGDIDGVMSLVADTCTYTVHFAEDLVQHAGRWEGAEQIRRGIQLARSNYKYLVYHPVITGVDGDNVRVRVDLICWHRASGEQISMTFTQEYVVNDGKIVRGDEYHDRAKLEAYFRLMQMTAAEDGREWKG